MRHKSFIRKLTAAFMSVCLTIGSAGTLPVTVYGNSEGTDTTDIISTDSPDFDIVEKVADLLAQGDYEEGRAIVLYDTESPASDEELVGAGDLIAGAEQIAEVSAESYVNATGETLQLSDEELVGASSDSADNDRIAVLVVEDQSRSTEELLRELLSDPRVLSAEPDYIFSVNSVDQDVPSDELLGSDSVIPDTESSTGSELEPFVQNPSVSIPEDEYADQDSDTDYDTDDETVTSDIADLPVPDSDAANIDGAGSADQSADALVSDDAEEEVIVGASGDLTPYQWGMSDGKNRYAGAMLENTEVYSVNSPNWNTVGATNAEGVIAVIDTGIDHTHPDLKDNMYVIPNSVREKLGCGEYGISTMVKVREKTDTMDVHGHGTHCAGIIAASWNNRGVSGVASGAELMAVRALDDKGFSNYSSILLALNFVKDAKENGIDIRATNNSYGVTTFSYALRTMIEELGNLGIICVFASGNESSYVNPTTGGMNHLWDLPNVVIVNASAENGDKALFSNFSQNETHIFAPGVNILSTVPTAGSDEAPIDYFAELDDAPLYKDPSWKNLSSDMIPNVSFDWMKDSYFDYFQITQMIDISSCGQTPALRIKLLKDVPAGKEMTYCFLIPVGKDAPVSYVSADILTPDSDTTTTLRIRTRTDGDTISDIFCCQRDDHYDWVHRSVINLDKIDGTIDMVEDVYLPVYIDLNKKDGSSLKAGEYIYIDNICVGSSSYRNNQTAYGFMDGTSMATPFAAGMAMVLYKGKEVNRQNANLLAAGLQGLVRTKDSLAGYCTSGGVLDYSVDSNAMLPVINSATLNGTDLTITLSGYFFGNRGTQSSVNLAGTDLEIVSWSNNEVVVKCPDRMASGLQKIVLTDAIGLTTRGAFSLTVPKDSEIEDTATELYETTLPDIPEDVISADESICNVCGLNDTIYITAGTPVGDEFYAEKLVSYSIKDKKWEVTALIPEEGLADCSMTAFQGTLFLNGTDLTGKAYLYYYSPSKKDWYLLEESGVADATIVNFKNNLLSIGGSPLEAASEIRLIDVSTGKDSLLTDLGYKIAAVQTAVCGDTLCLYGGSIYNENTKKWESDRNGSACYTITGEGVSRDTRKEINIEPLLMKNSEDLESAICSSDKEIYLVGAQLSQDASGSVIDPSGYQIADGDTWVYSDQMKNLGKRLSHTIVTFPRAVVYKGVLYGFGLNTQDGNPTEYVARATVVDETPDTPIQDTIKIKIPTAKKGLKYNGKAQTGVPASGEGFYNIKNNRKTDPGTYKARAELIDQDYLVWEDGTSAAKTITWSIAPISVTGVKLDKTNLTVYAGTTTQLKATVIPSGANNKAVTWKSADAKIAKVDQNGKVTAVKAGTVKVTVTTKDGAKKATCTVKVIAGVPVYRLYDIKGTGDHLFTTSAYEKDTLTLRGWKYEGIAWYEPKTSSRPVYRSYNPNNGLHMYTYSDTERSALAGAGWKMEGIAFYSCTDSSKVPVYRLYNPNGGTHFFTKAVSEKNMLVKAGWKYEGIGFYALGI
ncbi:MAG: S8 family serine peptidase [Lachnospiraceae bacterium]|nr:S8 family serine peptidase [Lachnospiraceae bacterium]